MTINKATYIIIAVLAATVQTTVAQTLTINECIKMALGDDNKQLIKSRMKEEQMDYEVKAYKSNFYPRINLFAADFYSTASADLPISGGQLPIYNFSAAAGTYLPNVTVNADGSYSLNQYALFPDQTMKLKLKNMFIGGVSITQPIYMGGKITAAYEMAQLGKEMTQVSTSLTRDEVIVETVEAYMLAVKAKEMIEVAQKYHALLEELKKNVESAFSHGLKTRNDVMKVQVKLNESELNISKAENAYRLAKMNLCHHIGKALTDNIDVTSNDIDHLATNTPISQGIDISSRPEYTLLNQQLEMASRQVKLTRSDYLPQVVAIGSYNYANGGELAGKRLIDNGAATVGVGVKVPLFTFGESRNKIRSAKAKQIIAQTEQADLNEQMMLEQQQALNNLDEAQKEVKLTTSAFTQAEENMRLSKQQYEVGYESLSDYLESQAMWQQAYAAKVEAQCQQVLQQYKYLKSRGQIQIHQSN